MSVTDIKYASDGASSSGTGTETGATSFTYKANWLVTCDSVSDQSDIIWTYLRTHTQFGSAHLPWFGRTFKYASGRDTSSVCRDIDVQFIKHSDGKHTVEATYEPITGPSAEDPKTFGLDSEGKKTEDPLKWRPEIYVGWTTISIPVERAEFITTIPPGIVNPFLPPGRIGPVVNSAIVPFDPAPEEELAIKVVRITRNKRFYEGDLYDRFNGTVNRFTTELRPFGGHGFKQAVPALYGWMKFFGAELAEENGRLHWRETKEVWIHPRAWVRDFVDRGLARRRAFGDPDGAGGTISTDDLPDPGGIFHETLKDAADYPLTEPVLFDGNGQPIDPARGAVYLRYLTKTPENWGGILW